MTLILFDIDGTLINTHGAGSRAFARAMRSIFGAENSLAGIRFDGQTDPLILRSALRIQGIDSCSEEDSRRLYEAYLEFLSEELSRGRDDYQILPGVLELLSVLVEDPNFVLGLATGNIEEGARLKLEVGDLNRYFAFGGFGSDAENRTELILKAIEEAKAYASVQAFESVIVIGDTPKDVVHGLEAGAQVLAVTTGSYSSSELRPYKPTLLIHDLSELETVMTLIRETHNET